MKINYQQAKTDTLAHLKAYSKFGWIKSTELIKKVPDVNTDMMVRKIVNDLRKDGIPIIASDEGYKYTEDKQQVMDYANRLKGRFYSMYQAYEGLIGFVNDPTSV